MHESFKVGPFRVAPHFRQGKPSGWLVDIPANVVGKRNRKFFDNQIDAEKCAKELDKAYRRGLLYPEPEPFKEGYTFSELVDLYMQRESDRVVVGKKKSVSVYTDKCRLKSLLQVFGDVDPTSFTETRILGFQKSRLQEGKSPATINSDMRTLRKVLNWAKRSKLISEIPDLGDPLAENSPPPYIPNRIEVQKILQSLPPRLTLLIKFLVETGCRPGEAYNLTWDCVDELAGSVSIRPVDGWTPKTQSSVRTIPLSDSMIDEIRKLPKSGHLVFPNRKGETITSMRKAFQTAVKNAGISEKVTPKTFRKVFATMLVEMGYPESVTQALLGHAPGSTVTRQYYVHHDEKYKRDAVNSLSKSQRECCNEVAA